MAYPGNPELSPQAQDRVMTAFRQVVGKLQEGSREEALIGLEFVLRLDPAYAPGVGTPEPFGGSNGTTMECVVDGHTIYCVVSAPK